jgi:hypothetical protein
MGGGTQTVQSTQSASKPVRDVTDQLATGLSGLVKNGSAVYNKPLYTGLGATTTGGISALSGAANNPQYASNLSNTMNEFGQIASGQRFGQNAPGYANLRQGLIDDTLASTNAAFNASGRFGGGANVNAANRGVASAVGNLDYQNYQSDITRQQAAAAALPGLYSASLAPAQAQIAAGSILDADALAKRQAEAQLYDAQNNRGWNDYARASSILSGTAGAAGQTTTAPAPSPFQQLLGAGIGIGSLFL